jgi:Fe2+ or Zn2+ uptake regulation protein
MQELHDRVRDRLAAADYRYTARRRRLVDLLLDAGRPVTLPELLEMDPSIPQSSTYRNLDVLERSGLVRRLTLSADHARFEPSEGLLGHHHHLICVRCGTVEDITLDEGTEQAVHAALDSAAAAYDFAPLHHSVDLHGHCAGCRPAV